MPPQDTTKHFIIGIIILILSAPISLTLMVVFGINGTMIRLIFIILAAIGFCLVIYSFIKRIKSP